MTKTTPHKFASVLRLTGLAGIARNRYHVLAELGRGGMGIVWKARDRKLDRLVAIKRLPREWTHDKVARERFMQEARAASAIDHQNICTIYDIGSNREGQLYIVMAHYEGETLKERIEREDLETHEIVDIATQICDGLEAAHARGIVHRDIKASNIILCCDGIVKVLDFGLAKRVSATTDAETWLEGLDTPGRPLGTANYMAPERILEMPLDPRSDIFSLGVLMYEMATKRRPFAGSSSAETVMNVLDKEAEPLTLVSPSRPEWLERIVHTALAKDARDRYPSALDLRNRLLVETSGRPLSLNTDDVHCHTPTVNLTPSCPQCARRKTCHDVGRSGTAGIRRVF
jgi:serine/threonine-protein kinase